jgi:hypothetical protein
MRVLPLLFAVALLSAVELERIPEHQRYEKVLSVRNPHDRALRIEHQESSCSCDTLELGDRFLLPLQETTLTVAVTNDRLSGDRLHKVWFYPSNPNLTPIIVELGWHIVPNVSVDLLPGHAASTDRPTEANLRDVYAYTVWVRPDQAAQRMALLGPDARIIRLGSPAESRPQGGLSIERIEYAGALWRFETRRIDEGCTLLLATAAEGIAGVGAGSWSEPVVVHTNHPHKPRIELTFHTALDPQAHAEGAADPWAKFR